MAHNSHTLHLKKKLTKKNYKQRKIVHKLERNIYKQNTKKPRQIFTVKARS